MAIKTKTKKCPTCGMGRVPADPAVPQADLLAEIERELTDSPGRRAFDARVERIRAEQAGRERR